MTAKAAGRVSAADQDFRRREGEYARGLSEKMEAIQEVFMGQPVRRIGVIGLGATVNIFVKDIAIPLPASKSA